MARASLRTLRPSFMPRIKEVRRIPTKTEAVLRLIDAVPMKALRATNLGSIKVVDVLEKAGVLTNLGARKIRAGILDTDEKDRRAYMKQYLRRNAQTANPKYADIFSDPKPLVEPLGLPKREIGTLTESILQSTRRGKNVDAKRLKTVSAIEDRIIDKYSKSYRVARKLNTIRALASLASGGALLAGVNNKKKDTRSSSDSSMKKRGY